MSLNMLLEHGCRTRNMHVVVYYYHIFLFKGFFDEINNDHCICVIYLGLDCRKTRVFDI